MVQTGCSHVAVVFGLGQNKGALDRGLCVKSQALSSPVGVTALTHRRFDVRLEGGSVVADALVACSPDFRMRLVDLLHHSSCQASEIGKIALQNGFAEVDICQYAVDRIRQSV